jgi:uncharacterized membrane protein (DUF373 family)
MNAGTGALKFYEFVERAVVLVLLGLLTLVVLWGTWGLGSELIWRLLARVSGGARLDRSWSVGLLDQFNILRDVFGAFLLILIGLELMKTIVMYLDEHVLHVEVVLTVAIIAVARHAIELDLGHANPLTMVGMGVMVLALAIGLYIFQKSPERAAQDASNEG